MTDTSSAPQAVSAEDTRAQMGTGTQSAKLFASFRTWRIRRLWFEPKLFCGDSVTLPPQGCSAPSREPPRRPPAASQEGAEREVRQAGNGTPRSRRSHLPSRLSFPSGIRRGNPPFIPKLYPQTRGRTKARKARLPGGWPVPPGEGRAA